MSINKEYLDKLIKSTEMAACGAYSFIGKNDKIAADKGAVDAMRRELNLINMKGRIVIGEGEMDEAPMLYIGEKLGNKNGQELDIAVDPLEGTNFVAKNLPNSFAMLAATEKNNIFSAPDTYMQKIAIGPNLPNNLLSLDNSVEKNINLLAEAKSIKPKKLTACILDRPRHKNIIESLKLLQVNIIFITDGDVSGAIAVADKNSPIDIYMGIGGAPEGVLAAAALSCLGGQIQTKLVLEKDQIERAKQMGINDPNKEYNIEEMIKGDVIFIATAITDGEILKGVLDRGDTYEVSSLGLHKSQNINKKIKNVYKK